MVKKLLLFSAAILFLIIAVGAYAGSRIVVVANSIDYANAVDFVNALDSKGRPVLYVAPEELDAHNLEKFIIILGGPDAPEGIGVQVRGLLSEKEQFQIREKGNRQMFVKTNVWRKGQVVMIIAGSHRTDTKKAMGESEPRVHTEATEERITELSASTANINLQIINFSYGLNSTSGSQVFKWAEYLLENNGKSTIVPMIDIEIQHKDGDSYKQEFLNTNVTHFKELFKPKSMWIDNYSEEVALSHGNHRLIVRLRDGADSTVVTEATKDFST